VLQQKERVAGRVSGGLRQLKERLERQLQQIETLKRQQQVLRNGLHEDKQLLARQVRTAYLSGRGGRLRMLLNQEDPALLGRMLAYFDYFNERHVHSIRTASTQLMQLQRVNRQLGDEVAASRALEQRSLDMLDAYLAPRESRRLVLPHLPGRIEQRDAHLRILRQEESALLALVERLQRRAGDGLGEAAPFDSLKGKLRWPVIGELQTGFGDARKGDILQWQGASILAPAGEPVHAVSAGRVVFSDWFQSLGMLIILDHGGGYLSLYGNNQELVRTTGEWVRGGELIAHAGDTGGRSHSGVYFEIRHHGTPVDPALWCSR